MVLGIASMNAFAYALRADSSFLGTVGISIITGLILYSLIALFFKTVTRWPWVSRVLFLITGLLGLLGLSIYYDRGGYFSNYPSLLFIYLLVVFSFVISGILILKGKVV
jgi:hypothetical protein